MSNYWTRLRDIITFLVIWLSLPLYLANKGEGFEGGAMASITFMWVVALIITAYLSEGK